MGKEDVWTKLSPPAPRKRVNTAAIGILAEEELRITLGLNIDDSEVAKPLGTSKRLNLCAVY